MVFPDRRLLSAGTLTLLLLGGAGCAPRRWVKPEPTSVLSAAAPVPAPVEVGRALVEEPPLPGEPALGWLGLEADVQGAEGDEAPLTAEAALRLTLTHHPEARAILHDVEVWRGLLWQARLPPNPHLEVETLQGSGDEGPEVEGAIEYDLTRLVLLPLQAAGPEQRLEAARSRAAGRLLQLGFETRAAFFAAVAAEQKLAVANRALDALAAARDAAVALHAAGNSRALDLATQVASFEAARAAVAELELEHHRAKERLRRAIGTHRAVRNWRLSAEALEVPEALELPQEMEARAVEASLELKAEQEALRALADDARLLQWRGWLPQVEVGVRTERHQDRWLLGAAATFSLPLFDRRQGEVAAAAATFDASQERLRAAALTLRSGARDLRNELVVAHRAARAWAATIVPARREVLRQALLQYNAMQLGLFELLSAQRALLEAELAQADASRNYWTTRAAVDALLQGQRVQAGSAAGSTAFAASTSDSGAH